MCRLKNRYKIKPFYSELSKLCRLPVDPLTLDSSNVKAFLLLQAHLTRLPLPNTDYLTDTKSVLDQTIRIIQVKKNNHISQH